MVSRDHVAVAAWPGRRDSEPLRALARRVLELELVARSRMRSLSDVHPASLAAEAAAAADSDVTDSERSVRGSDRDRDTGCGLGLGLSQSQAPGSLTGTEAAGSVRRPGRVLRVRHRRSARAGCRRRRLNLP